MERLKMIKDNLISLISSEAMDLHSANCEELGAAIDMVKDISEAIYYCSIVKAMDKLEDSSSYYKRSRYSYPPVMYNEDSMRANKRMYYHDDEYPKYYHEDMYPTYDWEMGDPREGRSARTRRTYMEAKELHKGKDKQMKELEKYLNELSADITEMISDASQEERDILSQKMTTLIDKIK